MFTEPIVALMSAMHGSGVVASAFMYVDIIRFEKRTTVRHFAIVGDITPHCPFKYKFVHAHYETKQSELPFPTV